MPTKAYFLYCIFGGISFHSVPTKSTGIRQSRKLLVIKLFASVLPLLGDMEDFFQLLVFQERIV